ncbi:hypothetical protein N9Y42_02860 [Mariniblastus sp.]|nr:hypothetical protein [Mariniblastus sp.]
MPNVAVCLVDGTTMQYQQRKNMRAFVLVAISFGLLSSLPLQEVHAQDDGGIAQLSSAAYAPDSPVRENQLFRYQTGHYGFAYNCDGEENKRNNPAICWRKADQCQLPRRMGCLERVRHEASQVSRRILDGMCDSGCENCRRQKRQVSQSCGCQSCLAKQDGSTNQPTHSSTLIASEQSLPEQSLPEQTVASVERQPVSNNRRRSGLVGMTRLASSTEQVEWAAGQSVTSGKEVLPNSRDSHETSRPTMGSLRPPVARITSVSVGSGLNSVVEPLNESTASDVAEASPPTPSSSTHRMGLLQRLQKVHSAQASDLSKPAKF